MWGGENGGGPGTGGGEGSPLPSCPLPYPFPRPPVRIPTVKNVTPRLFVFHRPPELFIKMQISLKGSPVSLRQLMGLTEPEHSHLRGGKGARGQVSASQISRRLISEGPAHETQEPQFQISFKGTLKPGLESQLGEHLLTDFS